MSSPDEASLIFSRVRQFLPQGIPVCCIGTGTYGIESIFPNSRHINPADTPKDDLIREISASKVIYLPGDTDESARSRFLRDYTGALLAGSYLIGHGPAPEASTLGTASLRTIGSADGYWILLREEEDPSGTSTVEPAELSDILTEEVGLLKPVRYFANPGNAGDAVIAKGTRELFQRLRFNIRADSETIILGGGGNLVPSYASMSSLLESLPRNEGKIIILPSTAYGCFDLLREFEDLTFIARERTTYHLATQHGLKTRLCHDAAFEIDYTPWGEKPERNTRDVLDNYRTDLESRMPGDTKPATNRDISSEFGGGSWNLMNAIPVANRFIDEINKHAAVNTDRLHVAIVATCLGKKVKLWPNSYHKNRSVFDMSLSLFPNIEFMEDSRN